MTIKNNLYLNNCKSYFKDNFDELKKELDKPATKGFFINTLKDNEFNILDLIDFKYDKSSLNPLSYYHYNDHISDTLAYNLGLIYPQGIESSFSSYIFNENNIKLIVDVCSAPGGKSINFINKYKDALIVSNDVNYKRALTINNNFERLGIDNAIITSLDTKELSNRLYNCADLVILDAPCSGEGMVRKTDEVFDSYSDKYIDSLSLIQESLLDNAYDLLNNDSYLIYSTCTYSFKEDEDNITKFLNKYKDIELVPIDCDNNSSSLPGTVKLSFLNNTEGQYIAILHKKGIKKTINAKTLKPIKDSVVDKFIKDNLNVDGYYLYKENDRYYMSFKPLINIKSNILRMGIYLGEIINGRFNPNHFMYRANSLKGLYKYEYDLNDLEYEDYIKGLELKCDGLSNNFYHLTYKKYSVGFGKVSNGTIKNKYPKGLRK